MAVVGQLYGANVFSRLSEEGKVRYKEKLEVNSLSLDDDSYTTDGQYVSDMTSDSA